MDVKEAVAQCLGGALSVAVQATTISITTAPGVAVLSVSAGAYEATVDDAQAAAKVDLKVRQRPVFPFFLFGLYLQDSEE